MFSILVLITYDVSTETAIGRTRLRKVAKVCQNYGSRVQNSVFECELDAGQLLSIKATLLRLIDLESDSLRFYKLGNNRDNKVEHYGIKPSLKVLEPLVL